jgi:sugar lactone lactonase YvrE
MPRYFLLSLLIAALLVYTIKTTAFAIEPLQQGNLLVLDSEGGDMHGEIIQVNPTTGAQSVWESGGYLQQPTGMVYDGQGNIIVSDYQNGATGELIRINLQTGQQTQITSGDLLAGTTSVVVAPDGNYIAVDQNSVDSPPSPNIVNVNSITGAQTLLLSAPAHSGSPLTILDGSTLDPNGNLYISNAAYEESQTGVYTVNTSSGALSPLATGGLLSSAGEPFGLLLSNTNAQQLFVADTNSTTQSLSALLDINTTTGAQSIVSSGDLITAPLALAQNGSGDIFVSNYTHYITSTPTVTQVDASIVEVDQLTGDQTLISSGGLLNTPQAILVIPEPASATITLTCFACLFMHRRRRNSKGSGNSKGSNV